MVHFEVRLRRLAIFLPTFFLAAFFLGRFAATRFFLRRFGEVLNAASVWDDASAPIAAHKGSW